MKEIKKLVIKNIQKENVPEEGYYIQFKFMHGDADYYEEQTVGAWNENIDLLLKMLNVAQKMIEAFPDGKSSEYKNIIPESEKFFHRDEPYYDFKETPEEEKYLDLKAIECLPTNEYGEEATLIEFEVYYHDGASFNKYEVEYGY